MQRLVVSGVQTPNCIRATAYDAVSLDYPQVGALHIEVAEDFFGEMVKGVKSCPVLPQWPRVKSLVQRCFSGQG